MRLEGREATQPLRPGGWRLAGDGGGGEVRLGIARDVRIGAVLVDPEQAAPAPRERERQHPLAQPALRRQHPLDQLLARMLRDAHRDRSILDRPVQRLVSP
jgi:hypothetical protein